MVNYAFDRGHVCGAYRKSVALMTTIYGFLCEDRNGCRDRSADDMAPECLQTSDLVIEELAYVEQELALRFKLDLGGNVREALVALDRADKLEDMDQLVSNWHGLLAVYLHW